jgi:hypothetical protein
MPMPFEATFIAHASPERVRHILRWTDAEVKPARGGRARVHLKAESMEQITTTVAAMAVDCAVEVVEPAELAGRLAEVGRRLSR